jgi:hypothetical protein
MMTRRSMTTRAMGVAVSNHSRQAQVYMRQRVGFSREESQRDSMEMGSRLMHAGLLSAVLKSQRTEPFDLALELASRICLGEDPSFRDGFIINLSKEESQANPFPVSAMYQLNFRSHEEALIFDMQGDPVPYPSFDPGDTFFISSKVAMKGAVHRPAVSIGWNHDGFHVQQAMGPGGPSLQSPVVDLFAAAQCVIEDEFARIDGLSQREKAGELAAYHAAIHQTRPFIA